MRPAFVKRVASRRQRGSVVVELALTMGLMLALLAGPFTIARSLLQINVTQRALANATRMAALHPLFLRSRADVNFSDSAKASVTAAMTNAGVIAVGQDIGEFQLVCSVPFVANCRAVSRTPELISATVEIDTPLPGGSSLFATFTLFDRYAHGGPQP